MSDASAELDAHVADANWVLYSPVMLGKAVAPSTVRGLLDGITALRQEVATTMALLRDVQEWASTNADRGNSTDFAALYRVLRRERL